MTHTHGPWVAWDDNRTIGIVDADGEPFAIAEVVDHGDMAAEDQLLADQRLITSAPILLAALIEAKKEMWMSARTHWTLADFKNWAIIQQIDAALTLATGVAR